MPRTLALLAALAVAAPAARADKAPGTQPGQLDVFDEAKLFSSEGIDKAKEAFRNAEFHGGLAVTVDTVTAPPAGKLRDQAEAAHRDAAKWRAFMTQWARDTAKADRAKGIYVLVTLQPVGGIAVLADAQTTGRGFTEADDRKVREILGAAFKEAAGEPDETKKQAIRSAALRKAVEFIAADLKGTRVADAGGEKHGPAHTNAPPSPVMGYVCFGLMGLAGVWLVLAVVRAFSGGGGGGMGGGAGGGGFFPSLLGGLFGAAAGMWMYSHFFGGGGGMFGGGGSDAYAGDAGGADYGGGDTGAGDWGGGSADAGGFDAGGGDFGGGGGDFGGDF